MTQSDRAGMDDLTCAAARTLTEVGRQIAARSPESAEAAEGVAHDIEQTAPSSGDREEELVTRLGAEQVVATNRELTLRSLRFFLR
jgi:hypothetical protein